MLTFSANLFANLYTFRSNLIAFESGPCKNKRFFTTQRSKLQTAEKSIFDRYVATWRSSACFGTARYHPQWSHKGLKTLTWPTRSVPFCSFNKSQKVRNQALKIIDVFFMPIIFSFLGPIFLKINFIMKIHFLFSMLFHMPFLMHINRRLMNIIEGI